MNVLDTIVYVQYILLSHVGFDVNGYMCMKEQLKIEKIREEKYNPNLEVSFLSTIIYCSLFMFIIKFAIIV